jgi:hypothetical protein
MEERAGKAIEKSAEEILRLFRKDYILKFAYIKSPKKYGRTMEFYNAWLFSRLKKEATRLSTELFYNADTVKSFFPDADAPDKYIHGSKYSSPNFVGANLPAILEGKQSGLWLSVNRDVKFWERFIQDMFSGGQLGRILEKHFLSEGFKKV